MTPLTDNIPAIEQSQNSNDVVLDSNDHGNNGTWESEKSGQAL